MSSISSKSLFTTKEPNLLSSKDETEQELYGYYSTGSLATTNQTSGPESPYSEFQRKTNGPSLQLSFFSS